MTIGRRGFLACIGLGSLSRWAEAEQKPESMPSQMILMTTKRTTLPVVGPVDVVVHHSWNGGGWIDKTIHMPAGLNSLEIDDVRPGEFVTVSREGMVLMFYRPANGSRMAR